MVSRVSISLVTPLLSKRPQRPSSPVQTNPRLSICSPRSIRDQLFGKPSWPVDRRRPSCKLHIPDNALELFPFDLVIRARRDGSQVFQRRNVFRGFRAIEENGGLPSGRCRIHPRGAIWHTTKRVAYSRKYLHVWSFLILCMAEMLRECIYDRGYSCAPSDPTTGRLS